MDILDDSALEAAASVAAAEKILKKAINEAVKNIKTAERKKLQKEQKRIAAVRCECNSFACPLLLLECCSARNLTVYLSVLSCVHSYESVTRFGQLK